MTSHRSYSDDALTHAVAQSRSWRGVLRLLGLESTSSSSIRSVRHQADRLGLDVAHFTGGRRWTDAELEAAIGESSSWDQVVSALGLRNGPSVDRVRAHARRIGVSTEHLATTRAPTLAPDAAVCTMANLRRAGAMIASAWFTLRGDDVSWPLEPCRYDLLISHAGRVDRVQVKTTTLRSGSSWVVRLASTAAGARPYTADEVDYVFVVDGDLGLHLIPILEVAGMQGIHLAAYAEYQVGRLGT